jgi:hypothetical protein
MLSSKFFHEKASKMQVPEIQKHRIVAVTKITVRPEKIM